MQALRHLYKEGGVLRFYRGYVPALAQGPLSRFGMECISSVSLVAISQHHFLSAHSEIASWACSQTLQPVLVGVSALAN